MGSLRPELLFLLQTIKEVLLSVDWIVGSWAQSFESRRVPHPWTFFTHEIHAKTKEKDSFPMKI